MLLEFRKGRARAETRVWPDKKPFVDPTSGPTSGRVAIAAA